MDELFSLNKIWETDNLSRDKDDEYQKTSDIEIIETEKKEITDICLSSDEDVQDDEEIIQKLKDMNELQDLNHMNEEDLNNKISDLHKQLSQVESEHDADDEDDTRPTDFDVEKIKELTAFVSDCVTNDNLDRSSTDDEGKFSDGDDDIDKNESEEILKSFVREISEERKMENNMENKNEE